MVIVQGILLLQRRGREKIRQFRISAKGAIQRSGAYYRAGKRVRKYNLGPMKHMSSIGQYGRMNPFKRPKKK